MVRSIIQLSWILLAGCCWLVPAAYAQRISASATKASPTDSVLTTKDGIQLEMTYYASDEGKNAVPIVLLHDYKESREVFHSIATRLQNPQDPDGTSYAVIVPDLRGHGKSTTRLGPGGQTYKVDAAKFRPQDYRAMVNFDMETVRKFLVTKNDAGQLNLNKLCLLGVGMGANVAIYWTVKDWNAPPLAIIKQGQDVKGLILVSPKWKQQGLSLAAPMKHPAIRRKISTLIAYGDEGSKASRDARYVYKILERYHPEPPRDQLQEKKDLFFIGLPTSLQGTKLLTASQFQMVPTIASFLDARMVQKDYVWSKRRSQ